VMFTIGTGVGGGTVLGGRLYRGATGAAPEIGHMIIGLDLADGAPADPGEHPQPGSLEALASGKALDRLAREAAAADPESFLGQRLAKDGEVTGHDCVDGAKRGDEASRRCMRVLGERLGVGIANAINLYDPLEVVIGGGVSSAGDLLLEPATRTAFRHVLRGVGTKTKVRLARHGPRAGVLGAALNAAQEWELDQKENHA
jgi:glucokinase